MVIIYFNFFMIQEANGTGTCRNVKGQTIVVIQGCRPRWNTHRLISSFPCWLAGSQAVGPAVSWPWVSGAAGTCDPLPLLSSMPQTLHIEGSHVPILCFLLCFCFSGSGQEGCVTGGCVVGVQLLWTWSS